MTKPTGMFWMQKPGALYNKMVREANAIAIILSILMRLTSSYPPNTCRNSSTRDENKKRQRTLRRNSAEDLLPDRERRKAFYDRRRATQ